MINENTPLTFGKFMFVAIKRVRSDYLLSIQKHANAMQEGLGDWIYENRGMLKALKGKPMTNSKVELNCNKNYFMSEEEANKFLNGIKKYANETKQNDKIPIRSYQCNVCGFWHHTSQSKF